MASTLRDFFNSSILEYDFALPIDFDGLLAVILSISNENAESIPTALST